VDVSKLKLVGARFYLKSLLMPNAQRFTQQSSYFGSAILTIFLKSWNFCFYSKGRSTGNIYVGLVIAMVENFTSEMVVIFDCHWCNCLRVCLKLIVHVQKGLAQRWYTRPRNTKHLTITHSGVGHSWCADQARTKKNKH